MSYNDDDNKIRRKKVSSNDYNYKSTKNQRYYENKSRIESTNYEGTIENNKIKRNIIILIIKLTTNLQICTLIYLI